MNNRALEFLKNLKQKIKPSSSRDDVDLVIATSNQEKKEETSKKIRFFEDQDIQPTSQNNRSSIANKSKPKSLPIILLPKYPLKKKSLQFTWSEHEEEIKKIINDIFKNIQELKGIYNFKDSLNEFYSSN